MPNDPPLQKKFAVLQKILRGYGQMAIAFSGGADSSLLLKIAYDTLGGNTLAFFADSPVQPTGEHQNACDIAQTIGAPLEIVKFNPLALPEFTENSKLRCYHCKKSIFSTFLKLASQRHLHCLADGTNFDDLSKDRPGSLAVAELGIKSPLAEAGLTKSEIRELSRLLNLPTWNKPSASCLATRIPTGTPITATDLSIIDRSERVLHDLGYFGCRARLEASTCHLELAAGDISRLVNSGDYNLVREAIRALGASKVFLDLSERGSILS
ncbi:MAG: ATP-dependent sacrificial sulfur transferase LarE [Desulfobulbaceae bacterium]|nr:ATP-dependent sacrificial sulfur transferase LarE [Desulfobulbaceae bacterium]